MLACLQGRTPEPNCNGEVVAMHLLLTYAQSSEASGQDSAIQVRLYITGTCFLGTGLLHLIACLYSRPTLVVRVVHGSAPPCLSRPEEQGFLDIIHPTGFTLDPLLLIPCPPSLSMHACLHIHS